MTWTVQEPDLHVAVEMVHVGDRDRDQARISFHGTLRPSDEPTPEGCVPRTVLDRLRRALDLLEASVKDAVRGR